MIGMVSTAAHPWTPDQFVGLACKAHRPKTLAGALPEQMKQAISRRVDQGPVTTARHRTEVLRKWFLRAKELRDLGPDPCVCDTAAPLLQGKCMRLLRELITASEYGDNALPEDIGKGFDLLGQIPASNVLPKKTSFASPEQLPRRIKPVLLLPLLKLAGLPRMSK